MCDLTFQLVNPWEAAFTYSPWEDSLGNLDVHNTTKNILNIVGCIPVASIVSGIARIIFALNSEEIRQQGSLNCHIFRGILEIGSVFGIGLIIADIYFTCKSREQFQENKIVRKDYDAFKFGKEEPEIISEYRPEFSVIPDEEGRLSPMFFGKYECKDQYEELRDPTKSRDQFRLGKNPLFWIDDETSVNKFFTLCEENSDYKLSHAGNLNNGENAFTKAARFGNVELLKGLIAFAPKLVDLEQESRVTPLMIACTHYNKEVAVQMAKLLIENGVNVNLSTPEYNFNLVEGQSKNCTSLHLAALSKNDALVKLLLRNGAILGHRSLYKEEREEMSAISEYVEYPIPKINPSFYNLKEEQVNYLFAISNSVTWEKCMPLVIGQKNYEIILPKDVVDLIIRIYKAVTPFW